MCCSLLASFWEFKREIKKGQDEPLCLPKLKSFWKHLTVPGAGSPMTLQVEELFTNGCFITTGEMQSLSHAELLDPTVPKKPYFPWQLLRVHMGEGIVAEIPGEFHTENHGALGTLREHRLKPKRGGHQDL